MSARSIGPWDALPSAPWEVAVAPSLVIGDDDERESHQFVDVTAAALMSDGAVVVTDARGGSVRVYDPDGGLRTDLGRRGDGPGEFQAPADVVVGPADTIRIWDRALWRITVFDPTGELIRSVRYDPTQPGYPLDGMWPADLHLGRDGPPVVRLVDKGGKTVSGETEGRLGAGFAFHQGPGDAPVLVARLPDEDVVEVVAPWGPAEVAMPLGGRPEVAYDGTGRACVGHGGAPQVLCVGLSGEPLGVEWIDDVRRVASVDPQLARWRADVAALYSGKIGRDGAEELIALVPGPESQPAFRGLTLDFSGHLWIDIGYVDGEWSQRSHLIVDPAMEPVGLISLPAMEVLEIGEGYVLAAEWTEVGTQQVVVYPLDRLP